MKGIGGAPMRATTLPTNAAERKRYPIATGVLDYFPDALVAIARLSWQGNEQHNPGKPLHWDRSKSGDEADTLIRHFLQRGTLDTDGISHTVKCAWRMLAYLQKEIEAAESARLQREDFPAADTVASRVDDAPSAPLGAEVVPVLSAEGHATAWQPARRVGEAIDRCPDGSYTFLGPIETRS
jgi:hypothetical protein